MNSLTRVQADPHTVMRQLGEIIPLSDELSRCISGGDGWRLAEILPQVEQLIAREIVNAVDSLDRPPASRAEMVAQLTLLTNAFPTVARADLRAYGRLLALDVQECHPSAFALELACVKLRRTSKWLPSIAEVLAEIATAEREIARTVRSIRSMPDRIAEARAMIAARARATTG